MLTLGSKVLGRQDRRDYLRVDRSPTRSPRKLGERAMSLHVNFVSSAGESSWRGIPACSGVLAAGQWRDLGIFWWIPL